jgi:hypothetical protein
VSVASCTASFVGLGLPTLSFVWRCKNERCRKIICELEWDGRTPLRHRCGCNAWTVLPHDAASSMRTDRRKW